MYLLQKYMLTNTIETSNDLPEDWDIIYGNYPTQKDNDSCGPMCCYYIWQKIKNPSNYKLSANKMTNKELRQTVVYDLHSHVTCYTCREICN